ncbi:MAG TPA: ATP-binding protein [Terriglobia bacterium]|nr:ATP-binding protein [Terriglobia bacterium]
MTDKTKLTLVWAALFTAVLSGYWAALRQTRGAVAGAPKTYHLALGLYRWRVDFRLTLGELGTAVIFILTVLLLLAVGLALLAEHRRRRVDAVNRKLKEEVAERKHAQEEVTQLNSELEQRVQARTLQLQRVNKELDAFCSSVSHDLRAPLRAIDGFSDILLRDYQDKLDDRGRGHLQRVRSATQTMSQLIDDLLSLSRVAKTEMLLREIDISAAARQVVDELRRLDPHRQVEVIVPDGLLAQGDPRLMRQVLENLLGNAWKYTSKRPTARIEIGACKARNGQPAFFVKDNGAGFDMTYVDKLFRVFQRLHTASEFPGTGVGLATVQRIIQRHDGEVWAEGSVDQGATFYFTLQSTP